MEEMSNSEDAGSFFEKESEKHAELWRKNALVKCPLCGKNLVRYRDFICKECLMSREDFER